MTEQSKIDINEKLIIEKGITKKYGHEVINIYAKLLVNGTLIINDSVINIHEDSIDVEFGKIEFNNCTINSFITDGNDNFNLSDSKIKLHQCKVNINQNVFCLEENNNIKITTTIFDNPQSNLVYYKESFDDASNIIEIDDCKFQNNEKYNSEEYHLININNCKRFIMNNSDFDGINSIILYSDTLYVNRNIIINNCNFENCKPEKKLYYLNSGIDSQLTISNSKFQNTKSIFIDGYNIVIDNCKFIDTYASEEDFFFINDSRGGAIELICYNTGKIINSEFQKCNAKNGGSIYVSLNSYHTKHLEITNCKFNNCTAEEKGSAIRITQIAKTKSKLAAIKNCHFDSCGNYKDNIIYYKEVVTGYWKWSKKEYAIECAKVNNITVE